MKYTHINFYSKNKNRVSQTKEVNNVSDRIEISKLGKSLTNYTLEGVNVDNSKKIEELKNQINNLIHMSNEEISNLAEELNKSDKEVQEKYDQDLINENEII